MLKTLLFLLLPFIGLSQTGRFHVEGYGNNGTAPAIKWEGYYIPIDTIVTSEAYDLIDLPETDCRIWYVRDFGCLCEYNGPAKLEWSRIPADDRVFGRVIELNAVHIPGYLNLEWRMINSGGKTIWR